MAKAANQIPATVTVVDIATGEETHKPMAWNVLPPPAGHCQVCGVEHDSGQPHNAQSLYYQMTFNGMVGRSPTWADAIAHCDDTTKPVWEGELRRRKAWTEPPQGEQPVRLHGLE